MEGRSYRPGEREDSAESKAALQAARCVHNTMHSFPIYYGPEFTAKVVREWLAGHGHLMNIKIGVGEYNVTRSCA